MVLNQANTMKIASTLGWIAVVLSVLILLGSGISRLVLMTQDIPASESFDVRYVQHPYFALLHIVPGVLFLTFAPLQFVARIRQRRANLHRHLGRLLVTLVVISGLAALVINILFPAFGGVSTQTATIFFSIILLFSVAKAFRHIRRKEIPLHREWMIRTMALSMGVATIRVFMILLESVTGLSFEEIFGASFWLGFGVNLLIAEVWINKTRSGGRLANRV